MVKSILVTGSHRSGSTWVGEMLSLAEKVVYIHEPFNLESRPGNCNARFDKWFTYVTQTNEESYIRPVTRTVKLKYNVFSQLADDLSKPHSRKKNIRKTLARTARLARYRSKRLVPLIKDPIAFFSAPWLADTFDMTVLLLIRHPAAFVGSLKLKNWTFPFSDLLNQPLLIEDHLSEFQPDIQAYTHSPHNIVEQGALLWNIIYSTAARFKENYPDWLFIRFEDVVHAPVSAFQSIYDDFELEFTSAIAEQIAVRTRKSAVWTWRERLTPHEIDYVWEQTQQVASKFYTAEDW